MCQLARAGEGRTADPSESQTHTFIHAHAQKHVYIRRSMHIQYTYIHARPHVAATGSEYKLINARNANEQANTPRRGCVGKGGAREAALGASLVRPGKGQESATTFVLLRLRLSEGPSEAAWAGEGAQACITGPSGFPR